jgi:hypothetical protein
MNGTDPCQSCQHKQNKTDRDELYFDRIKNDPAVIHRTFHPVIGNIIQENSIKRNSQNQCCQPEPHIKLSYVCPDISERS